MKLVAASTSTMVLALIFAAWPAASSAQVVCEFDPIADIDIALHVFNVGMDVADCPVVPGDFFEVSMIFTNNGRCDAPFTELLITANVAGSPWVEHVGPIQPGSFYPIRYAFGATQEGPISLSLDFLDWGIFYFDPSLVDVVTAVPDISVSSEQLNFGSVAIGNQESQIVSIGNIGSKDLVISDISLAGSIEFSTPTITLPVTVKRCEQVPVDIGVTYAPTFAGDSASTLTISSDDPDEPAVSILLSGVGTNGEVPADKQIEEIKTFMKLSLNNNTLTGDGPNARSSANRFDALFNMISAAGDMLAFGDVAGACEQLADALMKTDGNVKPPDFVKGSAAEDLAQMINQVRVSLGCL